MAVLQRIVPWLVLAVTLVFCADRLRSGVDLEDEATHLAIPYRFVLGDRPFIDEVNPIQTAGFLTQPLISAYVRATGGTDGIVLFTRVVYLLCCIGVAWIAVLATRQYCGLGLAALCAAAIVVHMPGIANLDYHTIGSLGFTAGVFAVAHGMKREADKRWIFLGGVMHACATIAIQIYLVSSLVFVIAALLWLAPERRLRSMAPYGLGAVATAIVFARPFLDLGQETILYTYNHSIQDGSWLWKAKYVLLNQVRMIPNLLGFGIASAVLVVATRMRWRLLALSAWIALPVLAYTARGSWGANPYATMIAMLAPLLYFTLRDRSAARPLFLGVWLPSFAAGLALAWASSLHVLNEGFAQLPACVVSSILAVMVAREIWPTVPVWPSVAWLVVVIASFLQFQRQPFNDDALAHLDTTISNGPWRGIRTTRAKADYTTALQADVRSFEDPSMRVLFFPHFPAGYLMCAMRPAASSVWALTCQPDPWEMCTEALERDLDRLDTTGVVVFDVKSSFHSVKKITPLARGPAHAVLERRLKQVLDTPGYTVFRSH